MTDREGKENEEKRTKKKGEKRSNKKECDKEKKKMITELQITAERKIKIWNQINRSLKTKIMKTIRKQNYRDNDK